MIYKPYKHLVQYYETDQMGIVHHSNYIRWFEEARSYLLEENGFGYDTLFYALEYEKPMGLLSEEEKNQISHRGKASRALIQQLLGK